MDTLILVGVIVGIVAGAIAILDKFFQILPRKTNYKKLFEKEFEDWKASNFAYTMPKGTFLKLLGYILNNDLDDERRAFALLTAIFYGDKSMHELISINRDCYEKPRNQLISVIYGLFFDRPNIKQNQSELT